MPRVNRDLQRRMAARRERERRRVPTERRYQFAPSGEAAGESGERAETQATVRAAVRETTAPRAAGDIPVRHGFKPFSAYQAEYAYVIGDLRRIAVVVGGLLVALVALWFVLPK